MAQEIMDATGRIIMQYTAITRIFERMLMTEVHRGRILFSR